MGLGHPPHVPSGADGCSRTKGRPSRLPLAVHTPSQVLWGFATFGIRNEGLLKALENRSASVDFYESLLPQDIAILAWALLVLDFVSDALLRQLFMRLRSCEGPLDAVTLSQLHQVFFGLGLQPHSCPTAVRAIPDSIKAAATKCFLDNVHNTTYSSFQRDVGKVLKSLDLVFEEEVILADAGHYTADIACLQQRILIEVDGPHHYFATKGKWMPNGGTVVKHRQLRASGYNVVSIPFYEWQEAKDKRSYLLFKLKGVLTLILTLTLITSEFGIELEENGTHHTLDHTCSHCAVQSARCRTIETFITGSTLGSMH